MIRYSPGDTVRRREVLHGDVWLESPVSVVSDSGDILAVRLDPGAPFTFPDHPFGPHPWNERAAWGSTVVLQLFRNSDSYAVWKIFEEDGTFRHWYVNFEAPIVRGQGYFDTNDYGLDLIIEPDGRRIWKDVEDLHHQRAEGRIDLATVGTALAAAAEVVDDLDAGTHWWRLWDEWLPNVH